MSDYKNYLSPYTWRYGSVAMRQIWSEHHTRLLWRKIWVALAQTQAHFGLVAPEQVVDLQNYADKVDVERALEIEAEIQHDLMAEVKTYAEQCPLGGGIIHLGATSVDVKDNATALQMQAALDLTIAGARDVLRVLVPKLIQFAETPVMAYTHLQPAEPTTLGYRLAQYAQDLLTDWENLMCVRAALKGKGFKGAVGTSASYAELFGLENLAEFEALLSGKLGLPFFPVTTQTYPRKQDYEVLSALAGLGASIYKLAFDLRILQSPPIGELAEPFGRKQIGSSAMPFKRNPIQAEKLDSLARFLAQFPRTAWDNAAHSLLERTLDDSANRRTLLPEAFLIADELLRVACKVMSDLQIDEIAIARNFSVYAPFAATERLLMALGKTGADRQVMHEYLRQHTLTAWEALRVGEANPLVELVAQESEFLQYLSGAAIRGLMDASYYVGNAPQKTRQLAARIQEVVG